MRLAVLGCYGGSAPGKHPTSLLVDGRLALDAGALTAALPLADQARVDEVYVTHPHLDHVANLPFLLDNVFPLRDAPVRVLGSAATVDALRAHVFNDVVWPDFTRLHNGRTHLLEWAVLDPGGRAESGDLVLRPFDMEHTVACQGYLVQGPRSAVAVCGDTRTLAGLPGALDGARGLAAVLLEVSFPDRAADVADASAHLTPRSFAEQIAALPGTYPVFVWHMKPDMIDELAAEIGALGLSRVALLEQGREYEF